MESDFMRVDLDVPLGSGRPPMWITQPPPPPQVLAWWGPNPRLRLGHVLEEVAVPVVSLSSTEERAGHPEHLLVTTLQEPPPASFAPVRRHWRRAASWLAWWVDIDSHLDLLAKVDVPTLLVAGAADDYNDTERMDLVAATLTKASPVTQRWYPADHGLKGVEQQVVADMAAWLEDNGIVERRKARRSVDARPAAEPTPPLGLRSVASTTGRGA